MGVLFFLLLVSSVEFVNRTVRVSFSKQRLGGFVWVYWIREISTRFRLNDVKLLLSSVDFVTYYIKRVGRFGSSDSYLIQNCCNLLILCFLNL